jgi:uncharacterized protein YbgA (DUF1722 family)
MGIDCLYKVIDCISLICPEFSRSYRRMLRRRESVDFLDMVEDFREGRTFILSSSSSEAKFSLFSSCSPLELLTANVDSIVLLDRSRSYRRMLRRRESVDFLDMVEDFREGRTFIPDTAVNSWRYRPHHLKQNSRCFRRALP